MPFTLSGFIMKEFIFGSIMCSIVPYLQGKPKSFFRSVFLIKVLLFDPILINFKMMFVLDHFEDKKLNEI